MTFEQYKAKIKEFNREIKECEKAAPYALTLNEKLNILQRRKTLREQKANLRMKWTLSEEIWKQ